MCLVLQNSFAQVSQCGANTQLAEGAAQLQNIQIKGFIGMYCNKQACVSMFRCGPL